MSIERNNWRRVELYNTKTFSYQYSRVYTGNTAYAFLGDHVHILTKLINFFSLNVLANRNLEDRKVNKKTR